MTLSTVLFIVATGAARAQEPIAVEIDSFDDLPFEDGLPVVVRLSNAAEHGPPDLELTTAACADVAHVVVAHFRPATEVEAWCARWGRQVPDAPVVRVTELFQQLELASLHSSGDRFDQWIVLDEVGRPIWNGPATESDEMALRVLTRFRGDPEYVRTLETLRALDELPTRGDEAKLGLRRRIESLKTEAPDSAAPWIAEFRVLLLSTPADPEAERATIRGAFEALAEEPVELASFVHRALWDDRRMSGRIAEVVPDLDDACERFPDVRTLEWARLRAALFANDLPASRNSALRLIELAKGRGDELVRIARELGRELRTAGTVADGDRALASAASIALLYAEHATGEAPAIALERCRLAATLLSDRAAAESSLREAIARARGDAPMLTEIARTLVFDEAFAGSWNALAQETVDELLRAADWKTGLALRVMARTKADAGDLDGAIDVLRAEAEWLRSHGQTEALQDIERYEARRRG